MRLFADLVVGLGTSTKTNDRLELLEQYFSVANDADKVWVIALFSGRRPKRTVNTTMLWEWCREMTGLPGWLFAESYHVVGDLAETIALLLPEGGREAGPGADGTAADLGESLGYYLIRLGELGKEDEAARKAFVQRCWAGMNRDERFVFNKLITGGFRIGISQQTVVSALARATGAEASVVAHRISGDWDPVTTDYSALISGEGGGSELSRPYPFYLAYALEEELTALGRPEEWQAEWKWDGIRGQLIRRGDALFVWSRGEELMTEKFPEYQEFKDRLPVGTVLDGEIIGFKGEGVLPFAALQTRIGRKNVTKKNLAEVPVGFIAYDLLEFRGEDWREKTLEERRVQLERIVRAAGHRLLRLSPIVPFGGWEELAAARAGARDLGSEGIMLKRKTSVYQAGRRRGDWWKWKIDPLVIDAVMVYAQKGHGRRSNLYTDYTFAVRDGDLLLTFSFSYL
jgi:DNA ligase-1